ncbi:MAG: M48 family metallopeptidase [Candidatus Tectomicrobia bacterium]|uniref:M48 family metallopeptidase n=1 Tax=Tectimicrobiota bacterium TaxID=2528274 RepID=A0A937W102_UNCTE|nr:M48 family metallopeptidase [Candidatus Tectomicrobia bacterium]
MGYACQTVPVTGRQQLILLSESEESQMGLSAYQQVLREERLSHDPRYNELVQRVGQRIAAVANRPDYAWEFRVIDKNIANAFALPGGKVAVYTGLFPYTRTEAGLAAVLAHEVAHALARHGGERVSQNMLAQIGMSALQIGLRNGDPLVLQGIALAYGLGVELPFNRSQESEADHIGLILMAQAGYDPHEAIGLWQRMEAGKRGAGPPEFLSTHPSGATRIQQLRQWLPEALQYYKGPGRS